MKKCISVLLSLCLLLSCFTGCGKVPTQNTDDYIPLFSCGLLPVRDNETQLCGYVNNKAEMIIPLQFQNAKRFSSCGLAAVKVDGKWGFVNTRGETVIEPRFEEVEQFSDQGFAEVVLNGKHVYIDPSGEMIIPPRFEKAGASDKSNTVVCLNEGVGYGIVDAHGNYLVEAVWEEISYNSRYGLYKLKKGEETAWFNPDGGMTEVFRLNITGIFGENGLAPFEQDGKYGYADRFGRIAIQPVYDTAKEFGDFGLAAVQLGEKWCYIDNKGRVELEIYAQQAGSFMENGLARVQIDGKWGFINQKGKMVIKPQFDLAVPFRGKYAHIVQDGKFGLIDQKGNVVVPPQYDRVAPYPVNGRIAVWTEANKAYGYTDEKGRLVIEQRFSYDAVYSYIEISELFGPFYDDGYTVVSEYLQASGYETRVIDKAGKCILGSENGFVVLDWHDARDALIQRERERNPIWSDGA